MATVTVSTTEVIEGEDLPITLTFKDSANNTIPPNDGTVAWTLTDKDGNIINSRAAIAVTMAPPITLTLDGDDTSVQVGETASKLQRQLIVEFEYDSDLGSNLKGKGVYVFHVRNVPGLPVTPIV